MGARGYKGGSQVEPEKRNLFWTEPWIFFKLLAQQCAILDQVVLSDVARVPSTESVRAALLRRGDAGFGVSCADYMRTIERFFSTAADGADSKGKRRASRRNGGQPRAEEGRKENHFSNESENDESKVQNRTLLCL